MEHFWSKVKKRGGVGCWEWQAHRNKGGYGQFGFNGKVIGAHRVSWILENGEIPDGLYVLHKCDNPCCVRPDHLFLGTHADNQQDKINKGRQPKGEDHCFYGVTGGDHPAFGHRHTEDAKRRIGNANIGKAKPPETIERMKEAHAKLKDKKSDDMKRVWAERRSNWKSKYDDEGIIKDYLSGEMENVDILKKYKVGSTSTLYQILKRNNVPFRVKSPCKK